MKLYRVIAIFLLIGGASGINDGPIDAQASGIVPFIVSFTSTGSDGSQDAAADYTKVDADFASVDTDDYDRVNNLGTSNFFPINEIISIDDFDANHYVKVYLTKGNWTQLPTGYTGLKSGAATDNTEFMVLVTVEPSSTGHPTGGLATVGNFQSTDFTGLDETANLILQGGLATHGVENAVFNVDARVLFDWITDIPGNYEVNLQMTVTDGS